MKFTQILESILLENPHKAVVLSVGCASFFPHFFLPLNFVYTTVTNTYKSEPCPHLVYSDLSVMLFPVYRPLLKLVKPVQN